MQSVLSFNEQQTESFKLICEDFCGPTMTEYVLGVLSQAIYALEGDPEKDPSIFNNEELRDEVIVCLAALEYAAAKRVAGH